MYESGRFMYKKGRMNQQPKATLTSADIKLIKDELEPLRAEFATKKDLKKFATKADLKRYATKNDLKATKVELRNEIRALEVKMTDGFKWVIEKFSKMRRDMVTKSDLADMISELKAHREEITANSYRTNKHSDTLFHHDQRITALEETTV